MSIQLTSTTDKWVKCISSGGTIRAVAVTAKEISQTLANRHNLTPTGTKALTESILAALILSSYCKSGEKINLNIQGSGWCSQSFVDANADGEIRGYIYERAPDSYELPEGIGPWGVGNLSILRTRHEDAQPYIGTVPLLTGHLPKDLTFYWLQSEQVKSAVGIEVVMQDDQIVLAEAFLIQAMPGATDEDITLIEQHLNRLQDLDVHSKQKSTPVNLLSYLLENQSFSLLEEKPLSLICPCSKDRVERSLALVGPDELKAMVAEQKDVEIRCDFCSENYVFSPVMLQSILDGSESS